MKEKKYFLTLRQRVKMGHCCILYKQQEDIFEYSVEKVGSRYRVQITGIGAHELGEVFTLTTGNTKIAASAMTYVQQSLANSSAGEEAKNAAAALYAYYQQAISYGN